MKKQILLVIDGHHFPEIVIDYGVYFTLVADISEHCSNVLIPVFIYHS